MDDWREKGAPVVDAFKVEIRKALAGMDILVNQETPSFCVSRHFACHILMLGTADKSTITSGHACEDGLVELIAKPGVKLYFPSQLGGDHYIDEDLPVLYWSVPKNATNLGPSYGLTTTDREYQAAGLAKMKTLDVSVPL